MSCFGGFLLLATLLHRSLHRRNGRIRPFLAHYVQVLSCNLLFLRIFVRSALIVADARALAPLRFSRTSPEFEAAF
jgi:hypothetical protein